MKIGTKISLLLLSVTVAGITAAWLLYKPAGKYDQRAITMLDKLYQPKYRTKQIDQIKFTFDRTQKTGEDLYSLHNLSLKTAYFSKPIQMEQLKLSRLDQKNKFPHYFTLEIKGLKITRDTTGSKAFYLSFLQLRLKQVLVDAIIKLDYTSSKKLNLAISLKFRELFDIDFKISLDNFSPQLLEMAYAISKQDPNLLGQHIDNTLISASKTKLTNRGVIKRLFKALSPAMTKLLKQEMAKRLASAPNPFARQGIKAFIDFIEYRKSITLTIAPNAPIIFSELAFASYQKQWQLLNATISAAQ